MNVNPIIIAALASMNLPVVPNHYEGVATEYIVFNYADERAVVSGSDVDLLDVTAVQVHYFTQGNPQANKKIIRRLLRAAGFIIDNTVELYESDTGYNHIIVECHNNGIIND